jgi:hypothetical protein
VPGQDGYVAGEDDDAVTGSIGAFPRKIKPAATDAGGEFDDAPVVTGSPSHAAAGDAAIRAEERRSAFH